MSSITRHRNCYQSAVIMICWRSYIVFAWWSNQATDPWPYLVLVDWRGNITSYVPESISGERKPSWLALLIIFSRMVACQKPPAIVAFTLLFILCLSFNRVDKKSQSWRLYTKISGQQYYCFSCLTRARLDATLTHYTNLRYYLSVRASAATVSLHRSRKYVFDIMALLCIVMKQGYVYMHFILIKKRTKTSVTTLFFCCV